MSRCSVIRALAIGALALATASAHAQVIRPNRLPAPTARVELDGPRFGVTFLPLDAREKLGDRGIDVGTTITQFGWQFERLFVDTDGLSPVMEVVVLVGGLDQGVFLPSLSWLVGLRTEGGFETGVGPNVTPAGVSLAIAAGAVVRQRAIHIPFNVAVVPSATGARFSLLTGFTMR